MAPKTSTTKTEAVEQAAAISIQRVERKTMLVPIVGLTPLIVHQWSEKAKRQMLDAQQGVKRQKEHRNPESEFESSKYLLADGSPAFPAIGFKSSIVGGARFYGKDVPMTQVKRAIFVHGEGPTALVRLTNVSEAHMREDMVKVGVNGTDLRYRPQYDEWSATLEITFAPTLIDTSSVLALIDAGGSGDGVGEWRPEKGGTFGTYAVDDSAEIALVG